MEERLILKCLNDRGAGLLLVDLFPVPLVSPSDDRRIRAEPQVNEISDLFLVFAPPVRFACTTRYAHLLTCLCLFAPTGNTSCSEVVSSLASGS